MKFFILTTILFFILSRLFPDYVQFSSFGIDIHPVDKDTDVKSEDSSPSGASDLKSVPSSTSGASLLTRFPDETTFFSNLVEIYRLSVVVLNNTNYNILVDDSKYKEALSGKGDFHRDASYSIALSQLVKGCYTKSGIDSRVKNELSPQVHEVDATLQSILNVSKNLGLEVVHLPVQEIRQILEIDLDLIQEKDLTKNEVFSGDNTTSTSASNDGMARSKVKDDVAFLTSGTQQVQKEHAILFLDDTDIISYIVSLFF